MPFSEGPILIQAVKDTKLSFLPYLEEEEEIRDWQKGCLLKQTQLQKYPINAHDRWCYGWSTEEK